MSDRMKEQPDSITSDTSMDSLDASTGVESPSTSHTHSDINIS